MAKLAKTFPKKMWKLKAINSVPSVRLFLSTAGDMFEKYPELKNSILFQALQALVCENIVRQENEAIEHKLTIF